VTRRSPKQIEATGRGEAFALLSFDVEEYFQVEAAAAHVRREDWESLPKRLEPALDRILELLADHHTSATFFVLGWVAGRQRAMIRRIAEAGHEIASHGMHHRMVNRLTPEQFRRDVRDSQALLEDVSSRPVRGYRAATFSITDRTGWALDVLADCGFAYDSSVFPIRHDRYGVPRAPVDVHEAVGPGGGHILEIPPLTINPMGLRLPVGGGGYLRLLPVRLVSAALRRSLRRRRACMLYLHPWELDPHQPDLPMGRAARWRHRVGLRKTHAKLHRLLQQFRFSDVRSRLDALKSCPVERHLYRPAGASANA